MPARKKNAKAELAKPASFTITIASTEANLQRIAALLMFADRDKVELDYDDCALPWEEPKGPPKPLELDYNTIRKDIVGLLQWYIDGSRVELAKHILGNRTLREIPETELLAVWEALKLEAPGTDA